MSRDHITFSADKSDFKPVTDFMIFSYVSFGPKTGTLNFLKCKISKVNILIPNAESKNGYSPEKLSFENLNIDFIKFLDKTKKQVLVYGNVASPALSRSNLGEQMNFFVTTEQKAVEFPLKYFSDIKLRYPDKIQLLAFAYASIFKTLVGNVTSNKPKVLTANFVFEFERKLHPTVRENPFEEHFKIEFKFGQLHIVSCGSRGVESISFLQIVTVFEARIWILLFSFILLIILSSKHLTRRSFSSSLLSIYKVLLEQGGPFPENNEMVDKLNPMICGILLTGLVISNAFKSENVYNIVTPRQLISYRTISELFEDNFKIYSRITQLKYDNLWQEFGWVFKANDEHNMFLFHKGWSIYANAEVEKVFVNLDDTLQGMHLKKCQMHPDTLNQLVEPLDLLEPLSKSGVLDWKIPNEPDSEKEFNTLNRRFWNNQNALIAKDMHNCSKTAWILPNYLAQDISRSLTKSGNHSDVGTFAFSKPFLYLRLTGLFPLSLLNQYSKVLASGLVDWWPNFINRTDLRRTSEKMPPKKPNMNGHTQVIFIILGSGLLIAISSLIGELSGKLFKYIKLIYGFCRKQILKCKAKLTTRRSFVVTRKTKVSISRQAQHAHIYAMHNL